MAKSVWFEDDNFLDALVSLLISDKAFAKNFSGMLDSDDFKARTEALHSNDRWVIASKALDHWEKFREPAGKLIVPDLKQYAKLARLSDIKTKKILKLATRYLESRPPANSIGEKVIEFKSQVLKANAIDEMLELQTGGMLTEEKWAEIAHKALQVPIDGMPQTDFFNKLTDRNLRRLRSGGVVYPYLMIEPLDCLVRTIAKGQVGMVMAPWKGRKSLMLLWIALAYTLQNLRVVHYTLEDPLTVVEDRLDSIITRIPTKMLADQTAITARRFPRFKRFVSNNLRLVDATGEKGLSIAQVGSDIDYMRENGFDPDAVIIDYDDEIIPVRKNQDRRFEFAEIYRHMRKLASTKDLLLWTAAQTNSNGEGKKILVGKDLAEDVSKARKVACCIGIGAADTEWGENSNYLQVVAHKNDVQHVGCHIMGNPERAIFYDHNRTMRKLQRINAAAASA